MSFGYWYPPSVPMGMLGAMALTAPRAAAPAHGLFRYAAVLVLGFLPVRRRKDLVDAGCDRVGKEHRRVPWAKASPDAGILIWQIGAQHESFEPARQEVEMNLPL
ncbi:hypothetical protein ACU4GD_45795 [Cupriavidus basilensis]